MIGYIYETTNLVNGKKYIGQHKAKQFEPEYYKGSGKLLIKALSKYGWNNFECKLLEECNSEEELNEKDIKQIIDALKKAYNESIKTNESFNKSFSEFIKEELSKL